MSDFTDLQDQVPEDGLDRRQMIKRAALVGGALVWATPVVQSIGGTAFAGTVGSPGGGTGKGISELTVLIKCGTAGNYTYTWGKYTPQTTGGAVQECGPNINVAESNGANPDTVCVNAENALKAAGGSSAATTGCVDGTYNGTTGELCVTAPAGCTIAGFSVHDGALGSNHCFYYINGALAGGNTSTFNLTQDSTHVCVSKP
jgi:hypothetical protein